MASGGNFEFSKDRSTKIVRFNNSNTDGAIDMAHVELGRQRIILILEMMKRSNCWMGSMVNGIPAINFSERFNQLLIKDMATTLVFKLLRRSIEYATLQNKINSLWRPSSPFQQYLTVQSWTADFNLMQPYLSVVKAWIRLSGLSDFFYKHRILEEIGGTIDKVTNMDFNTDSGIRGKFARMEVYINLDEPLVF
ncbi:hypothetical protein CXB51_009104 [Gossypium anomalum]|uniref:DUF4283 domain-containing protein n=1 Tax=Gossypium anomalum TaxID=47600 RepID=A0A8J6D648_9ROSI|nr:hypothetical protein CXB51_009104 [Gossypium anomalum]